MVYVCEMCGKACKNEQGYKIHYGHIHKKENLVKSEISELKEQIFVLTNMVNALTSEIRATMPTQRVMMSPPKKPNGNNGSSGSTMIGLNYGADHQALMSELKTVLKARN
jgi:hypothetical protein